LNQGPDWKQASGFICYPRKTKPFIYLFNIYHGASHLGALMKMLLRVIVGCGKYSFLDKRYI
jgi:hypothetical protein